MKRSVLALLTTIGAAFFFFGINAQASGFDDFKKGGSTDKPIFIDDSDRLIPVDDIMTPYARVITLPGPMKHAGWVSNYKLADLIKVRQRQGVFIGALTQAMGRVPFASFAVDVESSARLISADPLDRMKQAYWTGEDMYVGQYYPTSRPGLSTVPFIIYTKERLKFVTP